MGSVFLSDGTYVGNEQWAEMLAEHGIVPEKAKPEHRVCTIGFCEREQKWYGWSHRAVCGFGIGYVVRKGDCVTIPGSVAEYLVDHPEADLSAPVGFEAQTLEDCKRLAIAFADSVG